MKLEKGKKLVVYFGYLEEVENHPVVLQERSESNSQTDFFSKRREEVIAERNKLLEKLNKNREVRDVSDLFVKLPWDMLYNPIFFKIHLPLSLQKSRYIRYESDNACSEDFDCVYGGGLLFISTVCDIEKEPYGTYDARDRARVSCLARHCLSTKELPVSHIHHSLTVRAYWVKRFSLFATNALFIYGFNFSELLPCRRKAPDFVYRVTTNRTSTKTIFHKKVTRIHIVPSYVQVGKTSTTKRIGCLLWSTS